MHPDTALIISEKSAFILSEPILGTGGWQPPDEREELDWMTLIRFMGWRVKLISLVEFRKEIIPDENIKWIILTGNPDLIDNIILTNILETIYNNPILLISQAGEQSGILSGACKSYISAEKHSGRNFSIKCIVDKKYNCRADLDFFILKVKDNANGFAMIGDKTIVSSVNYGSGRIAAMSFQASLARDQSGYFTNILKHLLIFESLLPVVWYNWDNTMILRMDDPGSMETAYNNSYSCTKLVEADWIYIGNELKRRNAKISLGYVPAWVDDANELRSELVVEGKKVKRIPGVVYPSRLVKFYVKNSIEGFRFFDYESEFLNIQKLIKENIVDVQLHGFTHLHPDRVSWANSSDRYTKTSWYREFGSEKINYLMANPSIEHPLVSGIKYFYETFQNFPNVLICPGDEFTNDVLIKTLETEITLVNSYYLGMRIGDHLCWAQHVCTPYFDKPNSEWFDSGLPVIGYFHDFDICIKGREWFSEYLDEWIKAGAENIIDFSEVVSRLSQYISIKEQNDKLIISVSASAKSSFNKPMRVGVYNPGKKTSSEFSINAELNII